MHRAMLVRNTYYDQFGKQQLIGVMLNARLSSETTGGAGSGSVLDGMVRLQEQSPDHAPLTTVDITRIICMQLLFTH